MSLKYHSRNQSKPQLQQGMSSYYVDVAMCLGWLLRMSPIRQTEVKISIYNTNMLGFTIIYNSQHKINVTMHSLYYGINAIYFLTCIIMFFS